MTRRGRTAKRKLSLERDPIVRRETVAIRKLKRRAVSHGKALVADIIEMGKRLSRVKGRVGHDHWLVWVRNKFDWSSETATNYMNAFALSKTPEFSSLQNMPLELLYLLARRSVSPAARIAITKRVEAGEKMSVAAVRTVIRGTKTIAPRPVLNLPAVKMPATKSMVSPAHRQARRRADIALIQIDRVTDTVDLLADTIEDMPPDRTVALIEALDKLNRRVTAVREELRAAIEDAPKGPPEPAATVPRAGNTRH
jgi:hypothetical protein